MTGPSVPAPLLTRYVPSRQSVSQSVMCCVVIAQSCPTIAINPRSHRLSLTAGDSGTAKLGDDEPHSSTMINAFLVFNGQGQPRLTKFYTQLVSTLIPQSPWLRSSFLLLPRLTAALLGNEHPAAPHLRDLHTRLQPSRRVLQLPPAAPPARCLGYLPHLLGGAERCPLPSHLPPLCDALLHRHFDLDRVPPGPHRPDSGLRRGARQALRERVRTRPDLQL